VFGLVRAYFDDDPYLEALRNVMLACIAGDEAAVLDLINGIRFESTPRKTKREAAHATTICQRLCPGSLSLPVLR
jgi:hypothetical protein